LIKFARHPAQTFINLIDAGAQRIYGQLNCAV